MIKFNLKVQLLLVASIMLLLPWAGCKSISILEASLRETQSQLLSVKMEAAAQQLKAQLLKYDNTDNPQGSYYAPVTDSRILLDGFDSIESGWRSIRAPWFQLSNRSDNQLSPPGPSAVQNQVKFKLAANNHWLYVFIQASDVKPHYFNPTQPDGLFDQLMIRAVNTNGQVTAWQIKPQAAGDVEALTLYSGTQVIKRRDAGFWRFQHDDYYIELALPITSANQAIGFDLSLVSGDQLQHYKSRFSTDFERPLIVRQPDLNEQLQHYLETGLKLYLLDPQYWLIGHSRSAKSIDTAEQSWLMTALYNKVISSDNLPAWQVPVHNGRWSQTSQLESTLWYSDSPTNKQLLTIPITVGNNMYHLVAVQDSVKSLLVASHAFNQLLLIIFGVITIIILALLSFASLLSWRIVKLKRLYTGAIDDDGRILTVPPASQSFDELGELSRCFHDLTSKQQQYTDYLATVADKLSHELKTPVAVIRTSLENLEQIKQSTESQKYLVRAMQGTNRLSKTLISLNEATKLEQSFQFAQWETVPFDEMLAEVIDTYHYVYPKNQFMFNSGQEEHYKLRIAPELIVQLMDKIVSNAVDFSPVDQPIVFKLQKTHNSITLSIINRGPKLTTANPEELFSSMVSKRKSKSTEPHLGLGLHIVKLITVFHAGTVTAQNLSDADGVEFKLSLPLDNTE